MGAFLSGPRVIEIPQWLWQFILRVFILTRRPRALAPRYKEIWLEQGSPLLVWSQAQAQGLQQSLATQGVRACVALGMRYGNPSIADDYAKLPASVCQPILTLPMYTHYPRHTTPPSEENV